MPGELFVESDFAVQEKCVIKWSNILLAIELLWPKHTDQAGDQRDFWGQICEEWVQFVDENVFATLWSINISHFLTYQRVMVVMLFD